MPSTWGKYGIAINYSQDVITLRQDTVQLLNARGALRQYARCPNSKTLFIEFIQLLTIEVLDMM